MKAMRSPIVATVAALSLATAVAGCAQGQGGGINKQTIGTGVGAVAGGAIGSIFGEGGGKTVAIIGGALIGGLLGNELGRQMDENDRLTAERTTQQTLEGGPSGQTATWSNPDTGYGGAVTPQPAYKNSSGEICREYEQTITVDGQQETAVGVACRNPDGTWRTVSS
ncbi:MAG: RT0821/Lpp0805 family surface protein [Pseudomonadota bacterium]